MNLPRFVRIPVLCAALLFLAPFAQAQTQVKEADLLRTSPTFKKAFKDVVARPSLSTVRILCDGKETALGMVVGPDGWILTKGHDLKGKITCKLKNGKEYDAVVVGRQEIHDLAMLKVDAHGLTPVEFKESKKSAVGDWAASVGIDDDPVAIGVISVAMRTIPLSKKELGKNPPDLSKSGYLGIQLETGKGGVLIVQVMPDTAAAKAGLKANDLILTLNGKEQSDRDLFMDEMAKKKPGEVVDLKIRRGEEDKEIKVTLGKRPPNSNRGDMQDSMGSALSSRRAGYPVILQHDAVIKPTDCGGPLVALDGKVLAINVSRAGRTETWAIPTEILQPLLIDLMSGKLAPKENVAVKPPTTVEKIAELRAALKKAEEEKILLDKRLADIKNALAQAEAKAKDDKKTDLAAVDGLLELMHKRLALMTDVAKAKWNAKQAITDLDREKLQLIDLLAKGEALGLQRESIEKFFKAQFAAAKRLQEQQHDAWKKANQSNFEKLRDLKDLRADLDKVNFDLLAIFAKVQPGIGDKMVQERLLARAQNLLGGISVEVRDAALQPLMIKMGN